MAALTSVWLGTQGVPVVGEAVDATLLTLGVALVSVQAGEVSKALWTFANRSLTAHSDNDLKAAAASLAWAVSKVGVTVVAFVLTKKVAGTVARPRTPPSGPPLVTSEGVVIPEVGTTAAQTDTAAPAATASGVLSQGTDRPSSGEQAPAPKKVNPKAFAEWLAKAPKTLVRDNTPPARYQLRQAGPEEITVSGGGKVVRADGARASDAHLLEVKHIDKPETSPYVPGSKCNEDVREVVRLELFGQLQRYAAIIADPATPA
ncbi:MAG: restriction endonuclease fold toxin-2 domain-containing protein, partial [Archangium sp.]